MKYCKSCGIFFQVPVDKCIFCNNETEERMVPEKMAYYESISEEEPRYTSVKRESMIKKIMYKALCLCIFAAACICLYVDFIETEPYEHELTWSIIMVASGIYFITIIRLLFGKIIRAKKVIYSILLTALELVVIGLVIRDTEWVCNFIIPASIVICVLFATILLLSGKRRIYDYAIYVYNLCLLGIVPLILMLCSQVSIGWPSIAAISYCIITVLGLLFFAGRKFVDELKRRNHV